MAKPPKPAAQSAPSPVEPPARASAQPQHGMSILDRLRAAAGRPEMNAREGFEMMARWLGQQDEALSAGLRSMEDALRLYLSQSEWPEPRMPDRWEARRRVELLGYDPMRTEYGAHLPPD